MTSRHDLRELARLKMLERGLEPEFPVQATHEADAVLAPTLDAGASCRDLRHLPWISIDNEESRDLDQLSVAETGPGGTVRVLVAIADVAALVPPGSAIDRHARINTTSVYTPAAIFPMLPERLSTDLTSLNPGEERLAVVVAISLDQSGRAAAPEVFRAVVRNHRRLAYDQAAAWLDGTDAAAMQAGASAAVLEQLRIQDRVARAMRRVRHRHGALLLETPTARIVFHEGEPAELRSEKRNRATSLIEDLMIAANSATAIFLERAGFPSIRRVLRAPARWPRVVELAAGEGERLPAAPDARALQQFLLRRRQADPLRFPDLSLSVVKLLGSGEYVVERPGEQAGGHFGLAVRDYTHSTAPNRRYPDLATQRLLKAAVAGEPGASGEEGLDELARHCTVQEDNAAKVERTVRKSAAALVLRAHIGERFDAIVTGASAKGTWVRTIRPPVEGRVVEGERGLDVGDRVAVALVNTDVERGFIDFARVRAGDA